LPVDLEKLKGCLLGLALGDATGAPCEGGLIERAVWRLIGKTRRGEACWTDDTQMSIDVVESYLAKGAIDSDDLALRFARSYRWRRGYGPGVAKVLRRILAGVDWREASRSVYPNGSYGNGAAMRAPIVGCICASLQNELEVSVRHSAVVTHAHPRAIEGAILAAQATASSLGDCDVAALMETVSQRATLPEFRDRLGIARTWLETGEKAAPAKVARELGNGVAALDSVVTAIYLSQRFRDESFVEMLRFVNACRGDTDTIGAMAGAIWAAANGYSRLPADLLLKLEQRERILDLATALSQRLLEDTP
jgi:poly(ADP-ribose) glycohydrolase ARH3